MRDSTSFALGAAAGVTGSAGLAAFRSVSRRANIAVGLGGLALAGEVINQSALQTQVSNLQSICGQLNAITFITGGTSGNGENVAKMRGLTAQGFAAQSQVAYLSQGIGNLLSQPPALVAGNSTITGVTAAAPVAASNNSGILLLALLGLIGYALVS